MAAAGEQESAMDRFAALQSRLADVWQLNVPGSLAPHVSVVMPSFALGESLLAHYATRLAALEHRYLLATLMLARIPGCEIVFVTCAQPEPEVLDYYDRLASAHGAGGILDRLRVVSVEDPTGRSIATKLLDRPDLLARVHDLIGGRPAMLESWNVTSIEVEIALALRAPVNGTDPRLWPMAFKSAGRRLFREVGVPTPTGCEDVRDLDGVGQAVAEIRRRRRHLAGVVVKHDNSGAGDGNLIVAVQDSTRRRIPRDVIVRGLSGSVPEWYLRDLESGGVVEELVHGRQVRSPSAQLEITPGGQVRVLSTHEQILGGDNGQVYSGCRFPADPAYSAELCRQSVLVAERLSEAGAVGRLGVDFMAVRRRGSWDVLALEVNLRKGGTTHPFTALRHLAPGRYDAGAGAYVLEDGSSRWYRSTDGMRRDAWDVLKPRQVIDAVARAGLEFDASRKAGVVLHMLSCLKVDGRVGVTAIGRNEGEADELYAATEMAIASLV